MYQIQYNKKVENYLSKYFKIYREYYENLYMDSWLWNENQIIKWYIDESINRKNDIITSINNIIWEDEVLWKTLDNTIFITWRKKYIFVEWLDDNINKTRYIKNIEIR